MRKACWLTVAVIEFFLLVVFLPGQSNSARIVGNVHDDDDGEYLSGVTITAINVSTNAAVTVLSGKKDGAYRFLSLSPGIYQVSFDREGYQSYVASGIRLLAEQSFLLRVGLKRLGLIRPPKKAAAEPVFPSFLEDQKGDGFKGRKGKLSLNISCGLNYLAVGDTNRYLRSLYKRTPQYFAVNGIEYFHSGVDLDMEIAYQVSPRLEAVVGIGLIQDQMVNNDLVLGVRQGSRRVSVAAFQTSEGIKAIPLQITCRYWLKIRGRFFYSVYGSILFNIASWRLQTEYYPLPYYSSTVPYFRLTDSETAHARGLGLAAGLHGEWKMFETLDFTIDLAGRYAPLRNFSGRREWKAAPPFDLPTVTTGPLWFYEYVDPVSGRWFTDLSVGGRPAGPGTRNVARANVDFSGLALRFGLRVHF
jgi:hypothetical protein